MPTFSISVRGTLLFAGLVMCLSYESATPQVTFFPFVPGSSLTVGKPGVTLYGRNPAMDTMRPAVKQTRPMAYNVTLRE